MYWNLFFILILFISCSQRPQVHTPVGGLEKEDLHTSQNRAKQLNQLEREQIQQWITQQNKDFYPTQLNYWTDIKDLEQRPKRTEQTKVSFQYEIYDFEQVKIYPHPKNQEAVLGKLDELRAITDVLHYLYIGEEVTLLIPSVLAYGTYGDGDQIPHDMPIIIRLKLLK